MCYIKNNYPRDKFEAAFAELWIAMWKEQMNLEKPEIIKKTLLRNFSPEQVKEIVDGANSPKYKQKLLDNTKVALEAGAFGCPWFVVTNSKGVTEPFFGSDRYVLGSKQFSNSMDADTAEGSIICGSSWRSPGRIWP